MWKPPGEPPMTECRAMLMDSFVSRKEERQKIVRSKKEPEGEEQG
jgi:hypothetical protein